MNCCNRDTNAPEQKEGDKQHNCGGGHRHGLLMLACCLAPLGIVLFLKQSGYDGAAGYLLFLLCPLMHVFMMLGMRHQKEGTPAAKQSGCQQGRAANT